MNRRSEETDRQLLEKLLACYKYVPGGTICRKGEGKKPLKPVKWPNGYFKYLIRLNGKYYNIAVHRAVWAVCKGRWPVSTIDHIDGDRSNNRIENLRECSQSVNNLNILLPWRLNPVTKVPGICFKHRSFETRIHGKYFRFSSPYEAFNHGTLCGKTYK